MKIQKDFKTILVEYCASLSDEDLRFLGSRLNDRYMDDQAYALNFMSKNSLVDNVFQTTRTSDEVYNLCDVMADMSLKEAKKRKLNLWGTSDLNSKSRPKR